MFNYFTDSLHVDQIIISAVCSFIKALIYMYKTLSGHLQDLINQGKVQLGNPKSGGHSRSRSRLRERSPTGAFHYKV